MNNEILTFLQNFYHNHLILSWLCLILGFPEVEIIILIVILIGFLAK